MENRLNIEKSFSIVNHNDFKSRYDFLVKKALFPSKMMYSYLFFIFVAFQAFKQEGVFWSSLVVAFLLFVVIYRIIAINRYWYSEIVFKNTNIEINHTEIIKDEIDDVIKVESDNCFFIMRTKRPDFKRLYPVYNAEAFESIYIWLQEQGVREVTVCSSLMGYYFHKRKKVRIENARQKF